MNVLLLGGAGFFCRGVLPGIVQHLPDDARFTLADYEYRKARKIAKQMGERFSARMVDVSDPKSLSKVLSDADAAVTFVGPWYRFGEQIIEGCGKAGVPLVVTNPASATWSKNQDSQSTILTGIAFIPAGIAILSHFLSRRGYPENALRWRISVDFRKYGGIGGMREYFAMIVSRGCTGDEPSGIEYFPNGIFQKIGLSGLFGSSRVKAEFLTVAEDMRRRTPSHFPEEGVSVSASFEGKKVFEGGWSLVRDVSVKLISESVKSIYEGNPAKSLPELVSRAEVVTWVEKLLEDRHERTA